MKGPQDIRREKEYNLVPETSQRNGDEFDADSKYLRQINSLKEENHFLRNLSNRLQSELKEYQIRFPQLLVEHGNNINNDESNTTPQGANDTILNHNLLQNTELAPWISSSKYMSPLLVAYDSRIKELQEQIKIFQQNALEIKKESTALIKRNKELENELETKIISLYKKLKIKNKTINDNNLNNKVDGDHDEDVIDEYDFNEYQQRINILSQQNKLLRESEVRWNKEKENYLMIIKENKKNIDLLQAELKKVNGINADFEEITKNLNYENNQLKDINHELKNNVIAKLTEKSAYLEQQFKIETEEHNELKNRFTEYENEYNSLNQIHIELEGKYRMIEDENTNLKHNNNELNDEIIESKNALSSNQKKLNEMIAALENIENVLQLYKNKEMDYMKQINELKNRNELFINVEKGKLINEKEIYLKQLNKMKEDKKNILNEIKQENEENIEQLSNKYKQKIQQLQGTINDLTAQNTELGEERNEFENQRNIIENDMEQIKKSYLKKFEKYTNTENELKCKIKELELEKDRCSEIAQRKESDLKQQQNLWKSEREIYNQTISEFGKNDDKKNLTLIENEETILNQNELIEKLNEKLKTDKTRSSKHIEELTEKLTKNETLFNSTIEKYKKELTNLEKLYNESQVKTKDIISKHESLSIKWKEENRNTVDNFTNIVNELKKENKSLIHHNVTLESKIESVSNSERNSVSTKNNLKKKLMDNEKSIQSLTETVDNLEGINESYKKKETLLLNENKSLRNELNKIQISMQRLQRNQDFNQKINHH